MRQHYRDPSILQSLLQGERSFPEEPVSVFSLVHRRKHIHQPFELECIGRTRVLRRRISVHVTRSVPLLSESSTETLTILRFLHRRHAFPRARVLAAAALPADPESEGVCAICAVRQMVKSLVNIVREQRRVWGGGDY